MAEFVGAKLRITAEEGAYEGIVYSLDQKKERLTLTKVTSCTTGKKLHGFQNFFGRELSNLEVLQETDNLSDRKSANKEIKPHKVKKKREKNGFHSNASPTNPPTLETSIKPVRPREQDVIKANTRQNSSHLAEIKLLSNALENAGLAVKRPTKSHGMVTRDASDEGTTMLQRPPLIAEKYLMDDFYSNEDDGDELSPQHPPQTIVIQDFNDRFLNAIKYIHKQRVVGMACEGLNLGRNGKVCWVVIGCRQLTFLFDIISLGASCFNGGLREIMENGNILKVIHDCRQLSDALFHLYSIKLVNVFDTQVADIIIYKNEKGGRLPRLVNGLTGCLYEYLNLSPEQCHFEKVRLMNMQRDEEIWCRRPSSQQLLDATAKKVMYLRELRLAQMERLMAEFIFGVDIYLGIVRDAKTSKLPDKKNQRHMSKARLVPPQFQELYKFQHRQRNRKFDEDVPSDLAEHEDKSAWREGERFVDAYTSKHGHLKEHSVGPEMGWDDAFDSAGRGPVGTERVASIIRNDSHTDDYHNNNIDVSQSRRDVTHQGYLAEQAIKPGKDYGNFQQMTPIKKPGTELSKEDFEGNENAFQFRFSSPEELLSQCDQPRPHSQESSVDARWANVPLSSGPRIANHTTLFREEEFPALSSSASGSSFSSPTTRSRPAGVYPLDDRSRTREDTRIPASVPRVQPSLAGDSTGFVGRGRASLFQHMSNMPQARLPKHTQSNEARGTGSSGTRYSFPTDDELLASSEITHVPDSSSIRGATRVRVRKT